MEFDQNMPDLTDNFPIPEPPAPLPPVPDFQQNPQVPSAETSTQVPEPPAPVPPAAPPRPPMNPRFAKDFERIMALPPISREEAEGCRHKLEKRWYRRLIELNILMIVCVLIAVCANLQNYKTKTEELTAHVVADVLKATEESDSEETDESSDSDSDDDDDDYYDDFVDDFPSELQLFFYGIFALVIGYISLYTMQASLKAFSVKITKRNFPEIYQLIFCYAQRLGMEKVPDAYIIQQSGVLNAFSAFIFKRQYIQINSEIFETAYREHHDLNALAFIIAHEMSHIYYGHATLHYNLPIWFSMNFPLFGQIASRTREYSCDRLAQRLTDYDGIEAMLILMVDRHLYKMVDKQDYIDETVRETGFFMWLTNLFSTHPIMPKRIRALAMWIGNGELY